MPLKVDRRPDTGTLWITGTVKPAGTTTGVRVRQRAGSDDEALAREEAVSIEREILRNHHLGHRPVERTFAAAVASYLRAEDRSLGTIALTQRLLRHFGATLLRDMRQDCIDNARAVILRPGAGPSTWSRTVAMISAILNHAARRGWCDAPRLEKPGDAAGRTAFLLPGQYEALETAARAHLRPLLRYLICTGARLGEALALEWPQIDLSAGRVLVWADQTKADKARVVSLPPAAIGALARLPERTGRVFLSHRGEPYRSSDGYGGQIKTAWASALEGAVLAGFGPHDLRHSFASWHYALHRDLLALRSAGGWSSITLVERYAHLLPAGHEAAIRRVWGISERAALVVGG